MQPQTKSDPKTTTVAHEAAGLSAALPEALKRFPAAVHAAERVDAARAKVQAEFQDRALRAQARLTDWQGKAVTLVEKAQDKARHEKEKVLAETDAVTQRVEDLFAKLPTELHAKVTPSALLHERAAALLTAWMKLPADVRDDVLTVAGVATARQSAQVMEEIVALRAEIAAHFAPGAEVKEIKEAAPARRRTRKEEPTAEA
jgi:hypothetical protein